jgi:hypothetical protein
MSRLLHTVKFDGNLIKNIPEPVPFIYDRLFWLYQELGEPTHQTSRTLYYMMQRAGVTINNRKGLWYYQLPSWGYESSLVFRFKDANNAMTFRLTWG